MINTWGESYWHTSTRSYGSSCDALARLPPLSEGVLFGFLIRDMLWCSGINLVLIYKWSDIQFRNMLMTNLCSTPSNNLRVNSDMQSQTCHIFDNVLVFSLWGSCKHWVSWVPKSVSSALGALPSPEKEVSPRSNSNTVCAGHCSKCSSWIHSWKPQNSMMQLLTYSHFTEGNRGTEKLSNFWKSIWLVRSRAGTPTQAIWSSSSLWLLHRPTHYDNYYQQ